MVKSTCENLPTRTTLTDEELCEAVHDWACKLARSGGRDWSLSIPVQVNRDPDVLMSALARRHRAQAKRAQVAIDGLQAVLDMWESDCETTYAAANMAATAKRVLDEISEMEGDH